jgi:hypothetical protein
MVFRTRLKFLEIKLVASEWPPRVDPCSAFCKYTTFMPAERFGTSNDQIHVESNRVLCQLMRITRSEFELCGSDFLKFGASSPETCSDGIFKQQNVNLHASFYFQRL